MGFESFRELILMGDEGAGRDADELREIGGDVPS
jgi:hypothetical protein